MGLPRTGRYSCSLQQLKHNARRLLHLKQKRVTLLLRRKEGHSKPILGSRQALRFGLNAQTLPQSTEHFSLNSESLEHLVQNVHV